MIPTKYWSHTSDNFFGINQTKIKKKFDIILGYQEKAENQFWKSEKKINKYLKFLNKNNKAIFNMDRKNSFSKEIICTNNIKASIESSRKIDDSYKSSNIKLKKYYTKIRELNKLYHVASVNITTNKLISIIDNKL